MSESGRKRLKLALRAGISAVLIAFVLRQIDLAQWRDYSPDGRNLFALLTAVVLFNASKIAGALRLAIYQHHAGIVLGGRDNLMLYYAGMFLNLALPGGIGGDAYKVLILHGRGAASVATLIRVMLFDRLTGLLVLLLLGCLLLPFLHVGATAPTILAAASGVVLIAVTLAIAHARVLRMHGRPVADATGFAFVVQLLQLGCMAALLAALNVPGEEWINYLAVFLASSLAAALPLSIGGLGMREVTFLYGLRLLGLTPEKGVLAASAFFLITVLSSLPGVCFLHRFRKDN